MKQISFCMCASFSDTLCLYPFFNKPCRLAAFCDLLQVFQKSELFVPAGTIFDPPWLWQRILYFQLGTAAESTDLWHLQCLQRFSLAKCLELCRSCDQCRGRSQASVGPYGLKLELHGTLAIVFVNYSLCKHGLDLNLESISPVLVFFTNSWLPLAKIISVTLVIYFHARALLKLDPIWPPSTFSTIWSAPGQVAAYNMLSPTCEIRAGLVVLASKRMWAIQFNGEAGGVKMLRLEVPIFGCSVVWRRSKPKKSDTWFHQWGANHAAEKIWKNTCCIMCVFICTNIFLTHLLPAIDSSDSVISCMLQPLYSRHDWCRCRMWAKGGVNDGGTWGGANKGFLCRQVEWSECRLEPWWMTLHFFSRSFWEKQVKWVKWFQFIFRSDTWAILRLLLFFLFLVKLDSFCSLK